MATTANSIIPVSLSPINFSNMAPGTNHTAVTTQAQKNGTGSKGHIGPNTVPFYTDIGNNYTNAVLAMAVGIDEYNDEIAFAEEEFQNCDISSNKYANNLILELIENAQNRPITSILEKQAFNSQMINIAIKHIIIYYTDVIRLGPNVATFMSNRYDNIMAGHAWPTTENNKWINLKAAYIADTNKCVADAAVCLTESNLLNIDFGTKYSKLTKKLFPKIAESEKIENTIIRFSELFS